MLFACLIQHIPASGTAYHQPGACCSQSGLHTQSRTAPRQSPYAQPAHLRQMHNTHRDRIMAPIQPPAPGDAPGKQHSQLLQFNTAPWCSLHKFAMPRTQSSSNLLSYILHIAQRSRNHTVLVTAPYNHSLRGMSLQGAELSHIDRSIRQCTRHTSSTDSCITTSLHAAHP
jgi:hypothetical protein